MWNMRNTRSFRSSYIYIISKAYIYDADCLSDSIRLYHFVEATEAETQIYSEHFPSNEISINFIDLFTLIYR